MTRASAGTTAVAFFLGVAALAAAVLAQLLVAPFNHDEHPYIAAARLMGAGATLYRDFGYNHMPYLPVLYQGLLAAAPDAPPLLPGRGLAAAFVVITMLALGRLALAFGGGRAVALGAMAAFACNAFVVRSETVPIKDFGAMALALVAIGLAWEGLRRPSASIAWLGGAGMALGVSAGFKLPYGVFLAPIALVACVAAERSARVPRGAALLAGFAAGVAPLVAWATAYGDIMWFDNVTYHRLAVEAAARAGEVGANRIAAGDRWAYLGRLVAADAATVGILAAATGAVAVAVARLRTGAVSVAARHAHGAAAGRLALAGLPAPAWPHHLVPLIPFALLAVIVLAADADRRVRAAGQAALAGVVLATVALHGAAVLAAMAALATPAAWTSSRLQAESDAIAAALLAHRGPPGPGDRIATLAPVHALGAGYAIYPELATGDFFYRIGDLVGPEARARFRLTSPTAIADLLDRDPPAAVLCGFPDAWPGGEDLEQPLLAYALRRGYVPLELDEPARRLYAAPRPGAR